MYMFHVNSVLSCIVPNFSIASDVKGRDIVLRFVMMVIVCNETVYR